MCCRGKRNTTDQLEGKLQDLASSFEEGSVRLISVINANGTVKALYKREDISPDQASQLFSNISQVKQQASLLGTVSPLHIKGRENIVSVYDLGGPVLAIVLDILSLFSQKFDVTAVDRIIENKIFKIHEVMRRIK